MSLSAILIALASLASLASLVWLVFVAFNNGEKNWGILLVVSVFLPGVGLVVPLIFIVKFWGIARKPASLLFASVGLALLGFLFLAAELRRVATAAIAESTEFQEAMRAARAQTGSRAEAEVEAEAETKTAVEPELRASRAGGLVPNSDVLPSRSIPPTPTPPGPVAPGSPPTTGTDRHPKPADTTPSRNPGLTTADANEPEKCPLSLEATSVGDPNPNQLRLVRVRGINAAPQPVREVRLGLAYLDAQGSRLGRWMTVHTDSTNVVQANATNEFTIQAFFVPQFTKRVRVEVEFVRFADGSRWPRTSSEFER